MKKINFFLILSLSLGLLGCGGSGPETPSKPELAPICPEGFYRLDSIKTCTTIDQ